MWALPHNTNPISQCMASTALYSERNRIQVSQVGRKLMSVNATLILNLKPKTQWLTHSAPGSQGSNGADSFPWTARRSFKTIKSLRSNLQDGYTTSTQIIKIQGIIWGMKAWEQVGGGAITPAAWGEVRGGRWSWVCNSSQLFWSHDPFPALKIIANPEELVLFVVIFIDIYHIRS